MTPAKILALSLGILLFAAILVGFSVRPMIGQGALSEHPFQQRLEFTSTPAPSVPVPAGKRLRLSHVTARITVATGLQPMLSIKTSVGSVVVAHQILLQRQVSNVAGTDVYVASAPIGGIYADGGTDLTAVAELASGGSFTGTATVSGVLIDE